MTKSPVPPGRINYLGLAFTLGVEQSQAKKRRAEHLPRQRFSVRPDPELLGHDDVSYSEAGTGTHGLRRDLMARRHDRHAASAHTAEMPVAGTTATPRLHTPLKCRMAPLAGSRTCGTPSASASGRMGAYQAANRHVRGTFGREKPGPGGGRMLASEGHLFDRLEVRPGGTDRQDAPFRLQTAPRPHDNGTRRAGIPR